MLLEQLRRRIFKTTFILLALITLIYFVLFNEVTEVPPSSIFNDQLQSELDALPFDLLDQQKSKKWNESCANFAKLLDLESHNKYWQSFENEQMRLHIYGAYLDKRNSLPHGATIRLLVFGNVVSNEKSMLNFCQIWFEAQDKPEIVPIESYERLWEIYWGLPKQQQLLPYLVSCILPDNVKDLQPLAVSIVAKPCQNATNIFRVYYAALPANTKPAKFGICLKGLSYPFIDLSSVFIEWLELMRMFGVDKVYMSTMQVHPNITKVIKYYEEQDFLESRGTSLTHLGNGLPEQEPFALRASDLDRRLHEMIQYNDCFYRNIHRYEYVAVVDIDEIIMPLPPFRNWLQLLDVAKYNQNDENVCTREIDAFCFRHAHFPLKFRTGVGSIPLRFLKHTQRLEKFSRVGEYIKCWHNTSSVLAVHNHLPLLHIADDYCYAFLKTEVAQLQHYRYTVKDNQDLGQLITDDNILRFADELVRRSFKVFHDLGFMPDD